MFFKSTKYNEPKRFLVYSSADKHFCAIFILKHNPIVFDEYQSVFPLMKNTDFRVAFESFQKTEEKVIFLRSDRLQHRNKQKTPKI